jgi:hypothetical protein
MMSTVSSVWMYLLVTEPLAWNELSPFFQEGH